MIIDSTGQDLAITSFTGNGMLTWSYPTNNVLNYRVEWASVAGGPWTNFSEAAAMLNTIAPTGETMAAEIPMFYRVVAEVQNTEVTNNNYLVIDLSSGPSSSSYPITYMSSVPGGGWADEYKTTKLVLRRVPSGTFFMGAITNQYGYQSDQTRHQVTISKPFYIGVFEVTQKQWERVMGDWPSYFTNVTYRESRPVDNASYRRIRGFSVETNWPANNNVEADSFMGRLRARTGKVFDLPTESQWEYAARAGTDTSLNSGYNITNSNSDSHMSIVGRYIYNGGSNNWRYVSTTGGTAKVGSYLPNAWGIYDAHGNAGEWCLDWYGDYPGTVTDPNGPTSGVFRVLRGGGWNSGAGNCVAAKRHYFSAFDADGYGWFGLRIALPNNE